MCGNRNALADPEGGGGGEGAVCLREQEVRRAERPCELRGLFCNPTRLVVTCTHCQKTRGSPSAASEVLITLCAWRLQVNFGYVEAGEQKQALVKLRVCPECAAKLNYKKQRALAKAAIRHREEVGPPPCSSPPRCLNSAGAGPRSSRPADAQQPLSYCATCTSSSSGATGDRGARPQETPQRIALADKQRRRVWRLQCPLPRCGSS